MGINKVSHYHVNAADFIFVSLHYKPPRPYFSQDAPRNPVTASLPTTKSKDRRNKPLRHTPPTSLLAFKPKFVATSHVPLSSLARLLCRLATTLRHSTTQAQTYFWQHENKRKRGISHQYKQPLVAQQLSFGILSVACRRHFQMFRG